MTIARMRLPRWLVPPLCTACRQPAPAAEPLCFPCRRALTYLPREPVDVDGLAVFAPLAYDGPARAMVGRLKFAAALPLAGHMAAAMMAWAPPGFFAGALVPVPAPPSRRRRRGFDHARVLCAALAERAGLPVLDLLERGGDPRRQVGRTRADRLRRPPSYRAVARGDGRVMLVDDVVTTGATLRACSRALGHAGWRCHAAVAYARTPVR